MLELRHVTAGYGQHVVLRDVNLVVPDHGVVAVLGPNGAGKTTLLRVASGLMPPLAGRVLLDDEDVTDWPAHRLAQAGVCHVPEGRGVFSALSVRDNLRLQTPASLNLRGIEVATAAFPQLRERLGQRAGTMSGGEQQMLALAHPFVAEPTAVLLDEVSMGLAPKIVEEIFEHLRVLAARGTALLLVEQYVHLALDFADYVYVLKKGRVEFAGEPRQLRDEHLLAHYLGG